MKCENCGKEHNGTYGSGRFCSSECAHTFSSKYIDKNQFKDAICIKCGKHIKINKRSSLKTCLCDDCKIAKDISNKKISCGTYHNKIKGYCIVGNTQICDQCKLYQEGYCDKNKSSINYRVKTIYKYFFNGKTVYDNPAENIKNFFDIRITLQNLVDNGMSSNEICETFFGGVKKGNSIFKSLKINTRNLSESISNAILTGRITLPDVHHFYKSCWHNTWQGKSVYLRSSYELDYAKELDQNHIQYEVEKLRIKYFDTQTQQYRCAVPDFYLPETNTIVEVKSSWTLDVQNMKDKVKSYKSEGYKFILMYEHNDTDLMTL